MRNYKKRGYHTPAAIKARLKGAATMHSRKFIYDKTSVSVDKAVKYAAVEAFGNVHNALVFAVEHKGCNLHGAGEKADEQ